MIDIKMIHDELDRLRCSSEWARAIEDLLDNTDGVDFEFEESETGMEILTILRFLNERYDPKHLSMMFGKKLGELEVFRHRCVKTTEKGLECWNPLEQSLKDFKRDAKSLREYISEDAFPPPDIVNIWFKHRTAS